MKSWIAVPALGLGVAAILAFSTPAGGHRVMAAGSCVSTSVADLSVPEGVCLFSSETERVSQCKAHAALHEIKAEKEAMVWPLGIIELTADAAVGAWQVTMNFIGSIYDYAEEKGGDLI